MLTLNEIRKKIINFPPLYKRKLEELSPIVTEKDNVSVMQWNSLAQGFFNYSLSPKECHVWSTRKWRILEVIVSCNPDVILFEELNHFEFLVEQLGSDYEGTFKKKPDSGCLRFNEPSDGCAIFYRKSKFNLIAKKTINYENRNQVAILKKLSFKTTSKAFIVGVTHLKSSIAEESFKIRKEEIVSLVEMLSNFRNLNETKPLPLIFGGDFNEEPFQYCYNHMYQNGYSSTYEDLEKKKDYDLYWSTWKVRKTEVKRVIDFLFLSNNDWQICSRLLPPTDVDNIRLPSMKYPSDHLSLFAQYQFKENLSEKKN
ncbi:nocturnin [Anaeramoeba flamelloides]|uniref:Nocturnin n=1 Tax=Anaeramoeba flamelloides TaxID=1746091 RepID=A0ABQ8XBW8_9EUKA|nr:nocturnin [Anaeramoeba flamelloides]